MTLLIVYIVFTGPLFTLTAKATCINDYKIQQRKVPHNISSQSLKILDSLAAEGKVTEGWRLVSHLGDPYAFLAGKVLTGGYKIRDKLLHKLIVTHWINTNGVHVYKSLFLRTAQQHFKQYVQLLHTGFWPDSDQIVLSYLTAVRKNHLRDITVLDAAWDVAGYNHFRSWQSLNEFQKSRVVSPTNACMNVNKFEAQKILAQDFIEVPFKFIIDP
ncbi:MAG: hypothetical protein ACXWRZ_02140 [Bdellovibrio sp.]